MRAINKYKSFAEELAKKIVGKDGGVDYSKLADAYTLIDNRLIKNQSRHSQIFGVCLKTFISQEFEGGREFYFKGKNIGEALSEYITKDFDVAYNMKTFNKYDAFKERGFVDISVYNGALYGSYLVVSE